MDKSWVIRFRGHEWTDEAVTVAHVAGVAELIGDSWQALSPWNGPRALAAWVTMLFAATLDGDDALDLAAAAVWSAPAAEMASWIDERPAVVEAAA